MVVKEEATTVSQDGELLVFIRLFSSDSVGYQFNSGVCWGVDQLSQHENMNSCLPTA